VHSIGHGTITYAQPLGWGQDQGVVIVRHTFADGTAVLSFYGHLEPESIVLKAGDCVVRGDVIGRIGKPRSSPHLHFEIRDHLPTEPGRGYSPEEPALAGWKAPSPYIWQQRIAASPGVSWVRPLAGGETQGIGLLDEETYLILQDSELIALNVQDGTLRWRYRPSLRLYDALIHPADRRLYIVSVFGALQALRLSASAETGTHAAGPTPLEPVWEIELEDVIFPDLMPLPGGGVSLSVRQGGQGPSLIGVSPAGHKVWEKQAALWSSHWVLSGSHLLASGAGEEIWAIDQEGPTAPDTKAGGRLALTGEKALLSYDAEGVYRLDLSNGTAQLIYSLPGGFPGYRDIVVLQPDGIKPPDVAPPDDAAPSDGVILLTHKDAAGSSLTALDPNGALRWRRSYEPTLREQQQLLSFDGRIYLISQTYGLSFSQVTLFEIDVAHAELLRVFSGGSRNLTATDTWFEHVGEGRLLLHIGGTGLLALDTRAAGEALRP
jgi:outer membrane protein assembly factor BamB